MYASVEHDVYHSGPYLSWKHIVMTAPLESCEAKLNSYLAGHQEENSSKGGRNGGVEYRTEVSALVARLFRVDFCMVPSTDVKLSTVFQIVIAIEICLRMDINRLGEELEPYRRELDVNNMTADAQGHRLTDNIGVLRVLGASRRTSYKNVGL